MASGVEPRQDINRKVTDPICGRARGKRPDVATWPFFFPMDFLKTRRKIHQARSDLTPLFYRWVIKLWPPRAHGLMIARDNRSPPSARSHSHLEESLAIPCYDCEPVGRRHSSGAEAGCEILHGTMPKR